MNRSRDILTIQKSLELDNWTEEKPFGDVKRQLNEGLPHRRAAQMCTQQSI